MYLVNLVELWQRHRVTHLYYLLHLFATAGLAEVSNFHAAPTSSLAPPITQYVCENGQSTL